MITARDIMSDEVIVIYDDMLVSQVAHLMLRNRVSSFPVVSKTIGIVGIVTMTDFFRMINSASHSRKKDSFERRIARFKKLKVATVMTKKVVSITPQTTLTEIVHLLVEKSIHAFPVLENGKLVGIVGRHDILNAIFSY